MEGRPRRLDALDGVIKETFDRKEGNFCVAAKNWICAERAKVSSVRYRDWLKRVDPRLREFYGQGQAEMVKKRLAGDRFREITGFIAYFLACIGDTQTLNSQNLSPARRSLEVVSNIENKIHQT